MTNKPTFAYYRVFGDGMDTRELWATYGAENEMLEDCSAPLKYEGDEVEECRNYIIIYHDYFENC